MSHQHEFVNIFASPGPDGCLLLRDPDNHNSQYIYSRFQLCLFIRFDELLRAGTTPSALVMPGGYDVFAHIWNADGASPYAFTGFSPLLRRAFSVKKPSPRISLLVPADPTPPPPPPTPVPPRPPTPIVPAAPTAAPPPRAQRPPARGRSHGPGPRPNNPARRHNLYAENVAAINALRNLMTGFIESQKPRKRPRHTPAGSAASTPPVAPVAGPSASTITMNSPWDAGLDLSAYAMLAGGYEDPTSASTFGDVAAFDSLLPVSIETLMAPPSPMLVDPTLPADLVTGSTPALLTPAPSRPITPPEAEPATATEVSSKGKQRADAVDVAPSPALSAQADADGIINYT